IRLRDAAGNVKFARTFNWSETGVATGTTPVSVQFTLPTGTVPGAYLVSVIANGIASSEVLNVQIGAATTSDVTLRTDPGDATKIQVLAGANVFAAFSLGALAGAIVTGDNASNTITVIDDFAGVPVKVKGGGGSDTLNVVGGSAVASATWTIDASHVNRPGFGGITYLADVE